MSLIRQYSVWKRFFEGKTDANDFLVNYLKNHNPNLMQDYKIWRSNLRNIACPAMTSQFSKQLCDLEEKPFDEKRKAISFLAGTVARISDDLTDSMKIQPEEVYLLDNTRHRFYLQDSPEKRLFSEFHNGLEKLLPEEFKTNFESAIRNYNQSQREGQKLGNDLTNEELIKIKDNTGGYPFLFLYSLLFPEEGDPTIKLKSRYDPFSITLPENKAQAIFNLGAMASRGDDLFDENVDRKAGIKSLATERIVNWRSVKKDFEYVENGLNKFYPKEIVKEVMKDWRSQGEFMARVLNNHLVPFFYGLRGNNI